MNWVDIVIIVTVSISMFIGWRMSIIRLIALVIGVGLGGVIGFQFYKEVAGLLEDLISNTNIANIIAFSAIFLACLIIANIIGSSLRKILQLLFLGWVDKLAGATLGFLISIMALSYLADNAIAYSVASLDKAVHNSTLGPYLVENPLNLGVLPDDLEREILSRLEELKEHAPSVPSLP